MRRLEGANYRLKASWQVFAEALYAQQSKRDPMVSAVDLEASMAFLMYQTRDGSVGEHIRAYMRNIKAEEVLHYGYSYDIVIDEVTGDRWPRSKDGYGRKLPITFEALTGGRTKTLLKDRVKTMEVKRASTFFRTLC